MESALFTMAMSFINATTVLPAFVISLSGSEVLVGLASGLTNGAWLLPQLIAASAVSRMAYKKPIIVKVAFPSRLLFLLAAVGIALWGRTHPGLTLAVVLGCLVTFYVADGVISVAWFDLLAKAIPPTRRGRVLGISQAIGSVGGIAAGVCVRYILSERSPWGFPYDYASLFAATAGFGLLSAWALAIIREPEPARQNGHDTLNVFGMLARMPSILSRDGAFLRMILVRLALGFVGISSAFYVLHATRVAGLGSETTGLFVSAQVFGTLAAGLMMSTLQDRFGPLAHMRAIILLAPLPAALALVTGLFRDGLGPSVLYVYLVLYFFLGLFGASAGWPFYNWILEHAAEADRPLYIGMCNTLGALVMLAPALGGWIVVAFSYEAAFVTSMGFGLLSLALSWPLPDTRSMPAKDAATEPA